MVHRRIPLIVGLCLLILGPLSPLPSYAAHDTPKDLPYYVRSNPVYNQNVVRVQQKLLALGYTPGPADGYYGRKTATAVTSFQRASGLVADGIVGPKSWNALMHGSDAKPPSQGGEQPPAQPAPAPGEQASASLPVTKLVPFKHEHTGITGLMPHNWIDCSCETMFMATSNTTTYPDLLMAILIGPDHFPAGGAVELGSTIFASLQEAFPGDAPTKVLEQRMFGDGSGYMLVETNGRLKGSDEPFRIIVYARTRLNSSGLLMSVASVPAKQYAGEAKLIRQMVDSVRAPIASKGQG